MSAVDAAGLRVLVVAGREPWPLNSGGRLRLYHFLAHLSHNAAVTLALPGRAEHGAHLPETLRIANMHAAEGAAQVATRRSQTWTAQLVQQHFGHDPAIARWLWTHAQPEHFDVALLYGAVTGQYIDAVNIPAVWDTVDELVLYTLRDARRRGARHWLRTARAAALYAAFERHVAHRAQATLFASPIDASYARRWAGGARVESLSNGVDFDYFSGPLGPPEQSTVAFVGSLCFPPNVEGIVRFATRIWPRVRARGAGQRLLIVGREPTDAVRALERLPGVAVHADVPDVRPYLSQAAAVIVPTRLGGGVKNKVLEACAMQRPVVASSRALAGLTARRGRDVLCADGTAAWVRHLAQVLRNPVAAAEIGRRGYHWVRRSHNWDCLAGQLTRMLASAAEGRVTQPLGSVRAQPVWQPR